MTTIHGTAELAGTAGLTLRVSGLFNRWLIAFQRRRKRARLRATLYGLSGRDLKDVGIAWSEIEYLAANAVDDRVDPRRKA